MANTITILAEVEAPNYLKKCAEISKMDAIHFICGYVGDIFTDFVADGNLYVKGLAYDDISKNSPSLILGCERPEELKHIAENWNHELYKKAAIYMKKLEELAKAENFSKVSDYILNNGLTEEFQDINYYLKYALMDLGNSYNFNTDMLNYSDVAGWNVTIPENTLKAIKERPECFVLVTIIYNI